MIEEGTCFRNILLIQLGDIGDVVLTTPTIRALKETYPSARVSILVFKPYGSLLASDPNLFEVVEAARIRGERRFGELLSFVRRLRNSRYDLVIDLRTGDRGAILAYLTGAPVRVGSRGLKKQFWHNVLFTRTICYFKVSSSPIHPGADQSLRVLRELGIVTEDSTPKLYIAPADRQYARTMLAEAGVTEGSPIFTINPFSRWKYKEWDNAKWGEAIDQLWFAKRVPTVLIGSLEEATGCKSISTGREDYAINLAGKTTLGELAAIVSMSSLHLGVDSAAPHIAAALGIPTVTIHGPTDWRAWRVVDAQNMVVSANMECVPCSMMGCAGSGQSRCLDELDVKAVVNAALDFLAHSPECGSAQVSLPE